LKTQYLRVRGRKENQKRGEKRTKKGNEGEKRKIGPLAQSTRRVRYTPQQRERKDVRGQRKIRGFAMIGCWGGGRVMKSCSWAQLKRKYWFQKEDEAG